MSENTTTKSYNGVVFEVSTSVDQNVITTRIETKDPLTSTVIQVLSRYSVDVQQRHVSRSLISLGWSPPPNIQAEMKNDLLWDEDEQH